MKNLTNKFERLDAITAELAPLDTRRGELRDEASKLAVELLRAGAPPTEVADRSPFSTAHLRTLARIAGIPPGKPGGHRRGKRQSEQT